MLKRMIGKIGILEWVQLPSMEGLEQASNEIDFLVEINGRMSKKPTRTPRGDDMMSYYKGFMPLPRRNDVARIKLLLIKYVTVSW